MDGFCRDLCVMVCRNQNDWKNLRREEDKLLVCLKATEKKQRRNQLVPSFQSCALTSEPRFYCCLLQAEGSNVMLAESGAHTHTGPGHTHTHTQSTLQHHCVICSLWLHCAALAAGRSFNVK